jgi:valyl-tRNA synthetase
MIPFVTEEIHDSVLAGRLPQGEPSLLAQRAWPTDLPLLARQGGDPGLIPVFQQALSGFLRLRAECGVDAGKRLAALCTLKELAPFEEALKSLAKLESVTFAEGDLSGPTRVVAVLGSGMLALDLAGLRDPAAERAKLEKERDKLIKELEPLRARLADEGFLAKAPEAAVAKLRAQVEEKGGRLGKVESLLAARS